MSQFHLIEIRKRASEDLGIIRLNSTHRTTKLNMGFGKAHKMAQRLHRERRQPEHRKKFGYLEKKQDYKKRAIDHHYKAQQIKKLKNKAADRNPNEFHFHMINSRLVDGVHQDLQKPMDPVIKKKVVKKEELVRRYNERIVKRREQSANEVELNSQRKRVKRKHVVFT